MIVNANKLLKVNNLLFRQHICSSRLRYCLHWSSYQFLCIFCGSFVPLKSNFESKYSQIAKMSCWHIFMFLKMKLLAEVDQNSEMDLFSLA